MGFLRPWFLLVFIPVLSIALWMFWVKALPEFHWPLAGVVRAGGAGKKSFFRHLRNFFIAFTGTLLVLLFSGLFKGEVASYTKIKNYVIVLVQDRSGSMGQLLDFLGKVSESFMNLRRQDRFCGVYFSDTAVSTLCGESAKVITKVTNEDLNKSFSATSLGGGTEVGVGLLMSLEIILKEAGIYEQTERDILLNTLERKKMPEINEGKRNSHSGFIVIAETDADFPNSERIYPVQVLTVMRELGIRTYFMIFTKNSPDAVIRAVRDTGGKEYFIDPALVSKPALLEKELQSVFADIGTLNPLETSIISGIRPRTFVRELGAGIMLFSALYAFMFLAEEFIWRFRKTRNRKGGSTGE